MTRTEVAKTVATAIEEAAADAARAPARSTLAYQRIFPSLVIIQTNDSAGTADSSNEDAPPAESDAAAERDAAAENEATKPGRGLGTGVIVSAEGAILTANHVIDGATSIRVTFADGTEANAVVVSAEPENDIAVLMADGAPEVIVPAVLGGGVQIGDEVYAVGHPLGLVGSMSSGVVSGLERVIPISDEVELNGLIQFDAAVNPGNSGGPLLDRNGQVVGIVTALANPSEEGSWVGIGFAVPIETAGGAAGGPPR